MSRVEIKGERPVAGRMMVLIHGWRYAGRFLADAESWSGNGGLMMESCLVSERGLR